MYAAKKNLLIRIGFALVLGLLAACIPKQTPPGANSISGEAGGARYSYHYWDEGLTILFWYNVSSGSEGCTGTGSTEDTVFRLVCDVETLDGQQFTWLVETSDGISADLWIDGRQYDLGNGTMFLATINGDGAQIEQLARDFSQLEPDMAAIEAFAREDLAVIDFIGQMADDDS